MRDGGSAPFQFERGLVNLRRVTARWLLVGDLGNGPVRQIPRLEAIGKDDIPKCRF